MSSTVQRIAAGAALGGVVLAIVFSIVLTDDGASKGEIAAYEEALKPIVTEWGRIEVQGMRPAVGDLRSGEGVPPETVAGEARAWRAAFVELRRKLRAVVPPDGLDRVHTLFARSFEQYLASASAFEAAADGPAGPARDAGIEHGIKLASEGARIYNEASMALQAARREAGLPPSPDFPDHEAGQEDAP